MKPILSLLIIATVFIALAIFNRNSHYRLTRDQIMTIYHIGYLSGAENVTKNGYYNQVDFKRDSILLITKLDYNEKK
jgi:hypothetical protein